MTSTAGDGFGRQLRSEWTKLRSLRSTAICLLLAVGLTVLVAVVGASGSTISCSSRPPGASEDEPAVEKHGADCLETEPQHIQQVYFVHQSLTGDGSIVAHLASQEETGPDAKAGLLVMTDLAPQSPYAAVLVTPGSGVEWQGNFATAVAGTPGGAPRWLKLTRTGTTIAGFESSDGTSWQQVGTIVLPDLREGAEVGLFSTSPSTGFNAVRRGGGNTEGSPDYTTSTAVFDSVEVSDASGRPVSGPWSGLDVSGPPREVDEHGSAGESVLVSGSFTEDGDTISVTGAGDLGAVAPPGSDNDSVRDALTGIIIGFVALASLGALFITSEYSRGMVRTTFTATPHRGRVLAAKAVVLGGAASVAGLVASVPAVYISQEILWDNGFRPKVSITDGPVVRAVVGTALVFGLLAVLSLAIGTLLRRAASAIPVVIALVVLPVIIGPFLSLDGERWLRRITPAAGLAVQQTRERFDNVMAPWAGLGVLAGYVALFLALAWWSVRRRDA